MKIKIGIIGAKDSVARIKDVLGEFQEKVEVFTYAYQHKNETIEIIEKFQDNVDVILFSGQVPYSIAKEGGVIKKSSVFIPRIGTSVYRVFWQMNKQGIDYRSLSFDTIDQNAIEEVIKDLDIEIENIYVKSYPGNIDYHELVEFHYRLWKENKIKVAVTCLRETYKRLRELGVPVFRLFPTRPLIREYVNKAIYKGSVEKIKATQIAVQIVKVKNKCQNISSEYEFLKLKNKLEEALIPYTQQNFGSLFSFGRDEYLIFTTRGAIDGQSDKFQIYRLIESHYNMDIQLASGIGFGNTVYEAEVNARTALDFAMKEKYNCLFIVGENGEISGPIAEEDGLSISYKLSVSDEKMQEIAAQIQISPSYVSKIKAIMSKIGRNTIESEELSNYLGISVRSGRRILKQITDAGYAEIVANKQKSSTGRPRQIYKILF